MRKEEERREGGERDREGERVRKEEEGGREKREKRERGGEEEEQARVKSGNVVEWPGRCFIQYTQFSNVVRTCTYNLYIHLYSYSSLLPEERMVHTPSSPMLYTHVCAPYIQPVHFKCTRTYSYTSVLPEERMVLNAVLPE